MPILLASVDLMWGPSFMSCEITFTAKVISFGLNFCLGDEKEAAAFSVKSDISGAWIVAISEHFLTHVLALCGQDMEQQSCWCYAINLLNLRKNHACMNFLFLWEEKRHNTQTLHYALQIISNVKDFWTAKLKYSWPISANNESSVSVYGKRKTFAASVIYILLKVVTFYWMR